MNTIKELLYRIRGEYTTEKLISMGMTVGKNFGRLNGVILDPSHCWLITIGRTKVTLTLYEGITHFPWLSQVYHCIVNRRIAVWVVFTHYFTDDTSGFNCWVWSLPAIFVHCI